MILTCPACQTRYTVDAAKFPPAGRNVRCARCGEVWHATPDVEPEPEPEIFAPPPDPPAPRPAPQPENYAQPQPRDPAPQYDYEEDPAAEPAPSRKLPFDVAAFLSKRTMIVAGWAALVLAILVIGSVATVYRQQVVDAWPKSASFYSKLGMKVETAGLKLGNIKYTEAPQDGQLVLTVTGALTNVTNRELPVPQIRVGLVDGNKHELYHWTFAPDVMSLRPGQSTHFVTRLSSPPEGAENLDVRLAKAGE